MDVWGGSFILNNLSYCLENHLWPFKCPSAPECMSVSYNPPTIRIIYPVQFTWHYAAQTFNFSNVLNFFKSTERKGTSCVQSWHALITVTWCLKGALPHHNLQMLSRPWFSTYGFILESVGSLKILYSNIIHPENGFKCVPTDSQVQARLSVTGVKHAWLMWRSPMVQAILATWLHLLQSGCAPFPC